MATIAASMVLSSSWSVGAVLRRAAHAVAAAVPVSSEPMPAAWHAVALPVAYIAPMCAQLALMRGAAVDYDAGRLRVGGALLMGRAGGVFNFASSDSAERWVQINRDRAAAELRAINKLSAAEAAAWRADRAAVLARYAVGVVGAMSRHADADIRAGLRAEADFSLVKWG